MNNTLINLSAEILQALDIKKYQQKDLNRTTQRLRQSELGYNDGRPICLNKIYQEREDEEVYNEIRMRKAKPMYKLMFGTEFHIKDLSNRLKVLLKELGVHVAAEDTRGLSSQITLAFVDILEEIYIIYKQTAMQGEDGQQYFMKSVMNVLTTYRGYDFIIIEPNYNEVQLSVLYSTMYEVDSQIDRIMAQTLHQENDQSKQIIEYGTFNEDFKNYQDAVNMEPLNFEYNWEIEYKEEEQQEMEQIEVIEDAGIINYLPEFDKQFHIYIVEAQPEKNWQQLIYELLKDLCDKNLSNLVLEQKFYGILKNIYAAQYLLIHRKDIVKFLSNKKFLEQYNYQQKQNMKNKETASSNYQLLAKIGIDIDQEELLVLRKLELKSLQKISSTLQEGLIEFDPEQYTRMEQQTLLRYFPTSTRTDKLEYLYIRIDPLPKKPIKEDSLIPIYDLPEWARKAFEGTKRLNVIQSQIYPKAFLTEENLLVCAPTGAGKTNIALLAILQELSKRVDQKEKRLKDQDFKIVYISPMKALASEIVEKFQTKLRYLGVKVKEFTGDMQLSKKELQETHIILTTPEKWDVITRKTNQISEQLKLLIIDEVHLLNDDRGPILECVVARTLQQVQRAQSYIRLVGLSATLPNYWDVAIFLECHKDSVFFFDHTFRPVPLCQKFIGCKEPVQAPAKGQRRRTKRDIQNEQAYELMKEVVKHNKQVLIFVHSRKETVNYAKWIVERATRLGDKYVIGTTKINCTKVNDNELKKLLPYGLAFHHAGMLRADRNSVERFFLSGDARVLIATATLAWGVNLPAFAVIIKGTDIFDVTRADMQNLCVLDVQQMFGRAGRPQFDDKGEATLITDFDNVGHYMGMLNNASYIESKLLTFLREALNAEIVLGNITNYNEAYNWMCHTFLSIRLRRNPMYYGVERAYHDLELDCDALVQEKINEALKQLDTLKLVRFDSRNHLVTSTDLGRIASHYYIKCETMKVLCDEMGLSFDSQENQKFHFQTQYQLLKIVAKAKEFEMIRVRPEETKELQKIYDEAWVFEDEPDIRGESSDSIIETQEKVIALISAYLIKMNFENYALTMDTNIIIQNAIRLLRCMLDMAIKKNQACMALELLKLCKMIENRICPQQNPLFQFTKSQDAYMPRAWLGAVAECELDAYQMKLENDAVLANLLSIPENLISQFKAYLNMIPDFEIEYTVKPISQTILQLIVFITPYFTFSNKWHLKNEPFWIFVDDSEELLHSEEFLMDMDTIIHQKTMQVSFYVPFNSKGKKYHLTIQSDRWIMLNDDQTSMQIELQNVLQDNDEMDFTELFDLQPLPIKVLNNIEFEQLYEQYKYFNPIQTQVFFGLYNTDDNILIGAPTGSGKTIMAEFAMLRVFKQSPQFKIVYIAPLKAIAKERLLDWTKRLKNINKNVLELTGDYTPDLQALLKAHVLITTPEKWDGISRSWNNREYVKQTCLLIFDEIHLLGQERGQVLEVIVSRMNSLSYDTNKKTRMIGLSTAMANGLDVSNWFGVKKGRFYNFKPSCRPVPVTIHFNGFPERAYCPRMATMNKPAYQDIKRYSDGKPTIIFVSSRRQTRLTALDIIALAMQEGNEKQYIQTTEQELAQVCNKVDDAQLKQVLLYGVGIHHSGLDKNDRNIVENLFVQGKIQLLIATSTLAWGVNFPARLVIVKGTEFFDPKLKKYVDFPVTDLLQMIGRAGRPQYDTFATACVYVEQSKKNFYRKYLNSPFPIESSLLQGISDHINAEISSGVVKNNQTFIDWITWTYFFRRLIKNPTFYDCPTTNTKEIQLYLNKLIANTISELVSSNCITQQDGQYESTFLGNLAAFYYLKHTTLKHFDDRIQKQSNFEDLLHTLAYSSEFNEVPVRHNEEHLNEALSKLCKLKYDKHKMNHPNEKAYLLLQAHIFRLKCPLKDFETDQKLILDQCIRIIGCMIEVSASKGYLQTTLNIIYMLQTIVQGFVKNEEQILMNLPHLHKLKHEQCINRVRNIKDLLQFYNLREFDSFLQNNVHHKEGISEIMKAINALPDIQLAFTKTENQLKVNLKNESTPDNKVYIQKLNKQREASWWLILGEDDRIVQMKKVYLKSTASKDLDVEGWTRHYKLYLMSDSYLGLDQIIDIK
ncbi:unnamed protein product (macronuclear) [Paramecium tetraurelia]|uniref:Uncharacterized protein n=1 Tax=Paramecium tetraurelia TaxID=5888 RepID=A0CXW7_PARTE|nr:uncharacterized protein GSPATT00011266001 [Paramecium tetraurelia]CAK75634.1 unnamed protein product [Paramecium tetraurelia]|eukprot:XP_001443031.1 hypothetical protein (macronuclear) [Paramecium tetraurelia strain d4-2]